MARSRGPEPFTEEEITAMARRELEGDLPVDYARFLATLWERAVQIEALTNPTIPPPLSLSAQKYPEHEKLMSLAGVNQSLGEFIEWFEQDGRSLAAPHKHTEECDPPRDETRFSGRACGRFSGDNGILYAWEPSGLGPRVDRILSAFFGIDRDKLEAEKLAMLKDMRATQKTTTGQIQ